MKKLLSAAIIVLFAAMTFSCSSDDNDPGDLYVRFKMNGTQYNMVSPATASSLIGSIGAYQGNGATYRGMTLNMPLVPTVGAHAITPPSFETDVYEARYAEGDDIDVDAVTGTMTIESVNAEIVKGTFSWTGTLDGVTYNITDGEFRAFSPEN